MNKLGVRSTQKKKTYDLMQNKYLSVWQISTLLCSSGWITCALSVCAVYSSVTEAESIRYGTIYSKANSIIKNGLASGSHTLIVASAP